MAAFPTLSNLGAISMYPVTSTANYQTRVNKFCDMTEQRWRMAASRQALKLTLTDISAADREQVVTFFDSVKGKFDSTWSITFDGLTWNYMTFDQDTLKWDESMPNRWSTTLDCHQVRKN